ncbi:MAG: hypothetical protein QOF44_2102 [Streptomyces sp.]|nr:hypothetical protein [Streptomyces sp.]
MTAPAAPTTPFELLRTSGYRRLLLLAALVGIPVSLVAFGFMALEHFLERQIWESLPHALGHATPPWWWPLPALGLCGVLVACAVAYLPGHGGHIPAKGLGASPTLPSEVPGVMLAALAGLSLGAVLGPEAPLMAIGSGLALMTVRAARRTAEPQIGAVLGAAGSAAAISTIFGSPLVAAVLLIEASGVAGPQLFALILPCLLASGIGAVVFHGFGDWTGLDIDALTLPTVPPVSTLDAGDFLWGVPLAALIAAVVIAAMTVGGRVATWTARALVWRTVAAAVAVGVCGSAYALATSRSPQEVVLSGQALLADLAADPHAWPVSALILLLVFKGLAWSVSLGALRGGPVFPAVFLGSALGIACSALPGFGVTPALTVGLAAGGAAVLRLPVSASVLAGLLLGKDAADQMPLVIVASVVACAAGELLRGRFTT